MHYQSFTKVFAVAGAVAVLTACSADVSADDATGRTVDTSLGAIVVPDEIRSVVVIDGRRDLDIALSFGLPVVGMPVESEAPPEIPGPLTAPTRDLLSRGVAELFPRNSIDIEAVAAADPDLIIARDEVVEEIYDQLSAVAPVLPVGSTDSGVSWQDDVTRVGAALGREDTAATLLDEYSDRVDALRQQLAGPLGDTTVLSIATGDGGGISINRERITSLVLEDVGARFGQAWQSARPEADFAAENIPVAADSDVLLAAITSSDDLRALESNRLWADLPAVRDGRVVRTDKFTNDGGPITAQWSLDLVEQMYGSPG
ncbi:ABC transporter substrate-binding protein [Rhodococcus sp. NBC_00294]|uniref:ABC transporter substrate-binding protein n=1 Tax=Rhodococcus sp. NBC_00294 TaxID=2976004 RepID=UPI002E280D26|nr:ABC transporter substrate-binding protein [Rhodococcus sp. NBC_00294]